MDTFGPEKQAKAQDDNLKALKAAHDAIAIKSTPLESLEVKGHDFENMSASDRNVISSFCNKYLTCGFQGTELGRAIEIVKNMRKWRLSDEPISEDEIGTEYEDMDVRKETRCFTWLSFTSNLISSGCREAFVYLAKNKMVDCIVTSAGGIEEDIIKCLGNTVLGNFVADSASMRKKGWNRIGNLIVPNDNYVLFEEWFEPVLHAIADDTGTNWTPSKIINKMGSMINDETSLLYWCWKNGIPVFCPAITDGAIGDQLFFFSYKRDIKIDVVEDIRRIVNLSIGCKKSGAVILGGGVSKHHVCNANLFRNGMDFAVYINTAMEFDGCDSGGNTDEAVTWGKIKMNAQKVKVVCEATIAFPILVGAAFTQS